MNIESAFAPLLDLLVKSAAPILLGTALLAALRKSSAANRHAVSVAIFAALLLLPLTQLMPARWSFTLEKSAAPTVNVRLPLIATAAGGTAHEPAQPGKSVAQPAPRTPLVIPWKKLAILSWFSVAALLLARRAFVALKLRSIVRSSLPIGDGRLASKVHALVDAGGVRVDVRESELCPVPLASGLVRPVVLLPSEAAEWSDAYISSALRHELGHIRRRDCITRLLADMLCALYWLNPLVWFAARRMRLAQEQACDDLVLNSGAPADEYAGQLVDVVRSLQSDRFTARHALAMAQPSTLETRVLAIVDTQRDRSARSVRGTFAGLAFVTTMLALCAAAQLRGADEKKAAPASKVPAPLRQQVEIEAKFIEISGDDPSLPESLRPRDPKTLPGPQVNSILGKDKAAELLNALKGAKGVDLVSSPRVTTLAKQPAIIEVVREFIHPTEWNKNAKTGAWEPSVYDKADIGISFAVTWDVLEGESIELQMEPAIVQFEGWRDLDGELEKLIGQPDAAKPLSERLSGVPAAAAIPKGHRAQAGFRRSTMKAAVTISPEQMIVLDGFEGPDLPGDAKADGNKLRPRLAVLVTARIVNPNATIPADAAEKVEVQSDSLTFDKKTGTLSASGNVKIETAQATITAAQAEITPKKTGAAAAAEKIIFPKIDFRDSTLREAVDFLVAKSKSLDPEQKGVNVVLGELGRASDARITLNLANVPLSEVLRYVATLAGLGLREDEFAIFIGQAQAAGAKSAADANAGGKPDARWVFSKLDFQNATLRQVVDFLVLKSRTLYATGTGANIIIRNAEKIPDVGITLTLANVPLSEVLRYVAALANCEVKRDEFAFVIEPRWAGKIPVPNADQEKAVPPLAVAPAPGQPKGTAIKKAFTIIFPKIDLHDATLSETVEFLRVKSKELDPDGLGVNIILMPLPGGADPKLTLSLTKIPLGDAISYIVDLAGLECTADDHAITIRPATK